MAIEGVLEKGLITINYDSLVNWTKTGSLWSMTFSLARFAVEAFRQSASIWPHDCGR